MDLVSDLPPEALASMPVPASIIDQTMFIAAPRQPSALDSKTGQPKRGRGRPPGSPNKVKAPDGGINPPSKFNIPAGPKQPSANEPVDNIEATKEAKKARAEQYSTWIAQELNDKLLTMIIGAGVPAEAIYVSGSVPPKVATNPHLTPFGNTIAIPGDVADSWGKLFAELSYTDAGKNATKAADNHSIAIAFAALTALFSTYRYSQQLKPVLETIKQVQAQKAKAQEENNNGSESNS